MATNLEELIIKLDADLSSLSKELSEGVNKTQKSSSKMQKSFDAVNKKAAESRKAFNTWAKVAIAAFAAATGAMVNSQLRQVDSIAKTSDKLGIQTKQLIGLQHAAELTGNSSEMFSTALQRMTRRASEAAKGTGVMVGTLKELNIDAQEFAALSPDAQFIKLSESFKGVASQGDRVRLAMQAFDTEGVSLVNTMALGADGLREAVREAEKFGIAISRTDAAKVEAANDAITRAKSAFTGAARTLTVELAPIIEAIANKFAEAAVEGGGFAEEIKSGVSGALKVVGVFADGLRGIEIIFKTLEIAAEGFLLYLEFMFGKAQDAALGLINTYREFRGLDPLEGINLSVDDNLKRIETLKGELHGLLMEKLPSDGLQATLDEITVAAEASAQRIAQARNNALNMASGGSPDDGGASGVGGVSEEKRTPEERLEAIQIQNELELQLLRDKMTQEQMVLQEAFDNKLISEQAYIDKSTSLRIQAARKEQALEKSHQNKLLQAQRFGEVQRLNSFLQTNSDTLRAAVSFAGNSFSLTKDLNTALAITNTAAGVTKALSTGNLGLAAGIAIKGAAQIRAIRGTSLGGGGSVPGIGGAAPGGEGGAAAPAAPAAPPPPPGPSESELAARREAELLQTNTPQNRRVVTVELPQGSLLSTEQVRNLLDDVAREEPNLQVEVV